MAIQPRQRQRRAVNLDSPAGPLVPVHETKAREYWRANRAKNNSASIEKAAYIETNKAMVAANVGRFEFVEGNDTVIAEIAAPDDGNDVSIEKLYGLVTSGEITLPQFVSVVKATQGDVKEKLGSNTLAKVLVSVPKEVKLTIRKKKANE